MTMSYRLKKLLAINSDIVHYLFYNFNKNKRFEKKKIGLTLKYHTRLKLKYKTDV